MTDEFALLRNVFGVEETPGESQPADPDHEKPEHWKTMNPVKEVASNISPFLPVATSYREYIRALEREAAAAMAIPEALIVERRPTAFRLQMISGHTSWRLVAVCGGDEIVLAEGSTFSYQSRVAQREDDSRDYPTSAVTEMVCEMDDARFNPLNLIQLGMRLEDNSRAITGR